MEHIADTTEQMAHEMHRTVNSVESIAGDVKVLYKTLVAPFIEWFTGPRAKVQVLASTDRVR